MKLKYALPCLLVIITCVHGLIAQTTHAAEELRVMTFNIWVGGESGGQPLEQTAAVIKAANADIVGMQETRGEERDGKRPDNGAKIARMLGWNYLDQGGGTGVLSHYKITSNTPKRWGVELDTPHGKVWLFNVHLAASPYQPYQLLGIPYGDAPFIKTSEEAIAEANKARQASITEMLEELAVVQKDKSLIFITGDFNEPSALDWTEAVFAAKRCPVCVDWPTTRSVLNAGFVDTYRQVHPDPLIKPGYTWTPITTADNPQDHHDRIDLVLVSNEGAAAKLAEVVGENSANADIIVTPYPSDHRGVVATISVE